MTILRLSLFQIIVFVASCLIFTHVAYAVSLDLAQFDPHGGETLATNEPLFVRINYSSDVPVRFLASAWHDGEKSEIGASYSSAGLHASGKADALVWIAFDNPTHIAEVIVTAYDEGWNVLSSESAKTDIKWNGIFTDVPREPAQWVQALQKKERLNLDYIFDSEPKKPETASDIIFILSLISIPTYFYLQIRMLRRYRQRWRELATVPLVTAIPMLVYAFSVGIGFNLRLWPPFITYFMLASCVYFMFLWTIKRVKD